MDGGAVECFFVVEKKDEGTFFLFSTVKLIVLDVCIPKRREVKHIQQAAVIFTTTLKAIKRRTDNII